MNRDRIDRRRFLQISFAGTLPLFLGRATDLLAFEGKEEGDEILVVVQLSGGNDGLSMVVPHGDDTYHRVRRSIRVDNALALDDHIGLHANLNNLLPLYKEGEMAIVQGVSYPNPSRSHFQSMDIWHTADPRGREVDTGWLGRSVDACCAGSNDPDLVVNIGGSVPYSLRARVHRPVSIQRPETYRWRGRQQDESFFERLNQGTEESSGNADWLRDVASSARESSAKIRKAARDYETKAQYPGGGLAQGLRIVASLIDGGLGTRVYHLAMGGYDTHVRQRGTHDYLMRLLGDSIAAFHTDLAAHGHADRVVTMSFSEFGRRVTENASGGTDHGIAGPMLLFGKPIKGGIYGEHPSLTDLPNGDLKMTVDFRSVYGTIIDKWLGASSEKVLGKKFPEIGFFGRKPTSRYY